MARCQALHKRKESRKPMDPMDISAATSTGVKKRRLKKKGRKWHKRPHLRKTAVQPPTMQSKDKCGPKKIAKEWEQSKVWPSSKRTPKEAQQSWCMTNDCENLLKFSCTQCSDNLEYGPKDLVRHFEDKHRGSPPVFSCHMCTFNTHQFSYLQIHLLSHKDTFSSCSICNDGVQRTWPEFSTHLTMCHCQNGRYSCETCRRFSTSDVGVFLEHIYVHNLGLEGAHDDLLLHTKDKNPKPTTLTCQHCGYEASQKWLLTKHIKTIHVCQNGDQRRKKKEVNSIAMKPNDPIPKMKPRLTRSAVREMCWLTQDCLSLPGREFLDKYCHLSDPQTTLEETQQFLMKSVAGETGDQNWTKALKTVLSNVPQDVNLHPKSENSIMSNSSDLTVLTVKNKITVAQNGAAFAKRLRRMTASDKETVLPGSAAEDARCIVDQSGCQSTVNDYLPCPQTDTKLHNNVLVSAQSETTECTQMEENIENHDLKTDQEIEEHRKKHQEPVQEDIINISSELKLKNESVKQTRINKVKPRRRRNRRCKRKTTSKKVDTRSTGLPLKIVLKKNPVKGKQWVSKSSSSSSGRDSAAQILQNGPLSEVHQQKLTEASKTDLCDLAEAIPPIPQSKQEDLMSDCTSGSIGSENMNSNDPGMLKEMPSAQLEIRDDLEKLLLFSQTGDDERSSAAEMESNLRADAETKLEMCSSNAQQLQTSGSDMSNHESDDKKTSAEEVSSLSSCSKSPSSVSQPVIIPPGDDSSLALSLEKSNHSVEGIRDGEVPVESCSDPLSSTHSLVEKAIQQEPSPASGHRRHPVPKHKERTLKLVAINPSQLVKRPAGDQPVVVLNHPDVDIPEVARIMEVVNRYRGEVQKVMLSRRTLNALSAMTGEAPKTHDPTEVPPDSAAVVKERFILKLKFRKLNKKKYEVVSAVSASREVVTKFRCWFCGRVFASQEMWMAHRQRHLLEWKRPSCENS
ncbi:zinc finger 518A-like [Solea senegalensis]|uniref:Zinc finger 518A-like n=2 Tax=Solea senegalensis TaxID=28829 RepID=A0AAV6S370_SOLSE|nr:zinc finger 518A-like [Solea senegalensis]